MRYLILFVLFIFLALIAYGSLLWGSNAIMRGNKNETDE